MKFNLKKIIYLKIIENGIFTSELYLTIRLTGGFIIWGFIPPLHYLGVSFRPCIIWVSFHPCITCYL